MTAGDIPALSVRTEHNGKLIQTPHHTPPVTPTIDDNGSEVSAITAPFSRSSSFVSVPEEKPKDFVLRNRDISSPRGFSDDLEFRHDERGRLVEFGRGVWSIVYMASSCASSQSQSHMITPPSSPASSPESRVVAVKSPVRRDAHPVLEAEAMTLTRLSCTPGSENHVVPFHGYISSSHSIVMSAVPLSLSTYIEDKAAIAQKEKSTRTMFDPVQGMGPWQDLAKKLVTGLSWLHNGPHIVHGDIKPHNLLLQPRSSVNPDHPDEFPFEPLFADFSSAHDLTTTTSSSPAKKAGNSMTALTPPFAAPELLSLSSLTSPDVAPTPASDVFSLAVTLLAAATGDLLLYPGASNMQRLAMAREGHRVIEFAQSGMTGCRVPRNGTVERVVKPAVCKVPDQRMSSAEWLGLVESLA
ncbi:hypothetical protein ASPWEDRAFT_549883 [Aspergillus wentii DTO 134E9]|uniref:Protein kinase domain-containing protein n=1 Tax=Aspergillus wentii DTO 134E9 TaxID=1073089 RepID=A0A1L9RGF2_ASPWE|nr:uncharacterized protein ASPWEDRAFT_549883 [Aspergillus wentii DTO 134E9]KAI9927725.1 hypothetical protein MW887_002577 [Aspergillus wentii]OJJ33937.1 hypothetical protein ASPWEDRAFT_549883 [Aspergillus wentii DTO 134E9]